MTRKGADYFNIPLKSQNIQNKAVLKNVTFNNSYQEASYLVGVINAQDRKSPAIEENQMLACKIIVSKILGQVSVCKI